MARPGSITPLSRFGIFLLLGGVVLVLAWLAILQHFHDERQAVAPPGRAPTAALPLAARPAPVVPASTRAPSQIETLTGTIAQALAALKDTANPARARALDALRTALKAADPKVAAAAIRAFLATGQDAGTGLRFKVGEGGELTESPTLRTFLMDQLGSISQAAGLTDAAAQARDTLDTKNSADEWAVAMRNLAWSDPNGSKTYLAGKVRDMLNYAPWQQNPSGGYLEAFDVAAYSGDPSLIGELAPLAKSPSPVQQAALVALERLSAMSPAAVASYLNANPDVLSDRPMLRADYMGNMNLDDPTQNIQAQAYLGRDDVSAAEKEKFLARLATPAGFVSNNLLTPATMNTMTLDEHQAMVNRAAAAWLASGAFPMLAAPLQDLVQRTQPSS